MWVPIPRSATGGNPIVNSRPAGNLFHPFPRGVVVNSTQGKPLVIGLGCLSIAILFSVSLFISACSPVGGDVQAGRNALQTGHPNDAVGYLAPAATVDPNYKIPYRVRIGVLSYLGRAYLETGNDTEARRTLERAVQVDNDDPLAHLYLGIALLKTGERERGRKETEAGLRSINDTLGMGTHIFFPISYAILLSGFTIRCGLKTPLHDCRRLLAAKFFTRRSRDSRRRMTLNARSRAKR